MGCWCDAGQLEGCWAETWAFVTGKRLSTALAALIRPSRRCLRTWQGKIFFFPPLVFSTEVAVESLAAIRHIALVTKLLLWKCTGLLARGCTHKFSTARWQPAWGLALLTPVTAARAGFRIALRFKTCAIPGKLIFVAKLKAA